MRKLVATTIVTAIVVSSLGVVLRASPARAQAAVYPPSFTLLNVLGGFEARTDQIFDYGSAPPPKITIQNHNGDGWPSCAFSAISDHGSAQYQDAGGSTGYDMYRGYVQPRAVDIFLSVPVVFTLTLNCGGAGKVTVIISAELPPPPPPPPAPIAPVAPPVPTVAAPTHTPTHAPIPTHAPVPAPAPVRVPAVVVPAITPIAPTPIPSAPSSTPAPISTPTLLPIVSTFIATPIISTPVATTSPTQHALAPTHTASKHFPWGFTFIGVLGILWAAGVTYWMAFHKKPKSV